jgi:hypothetical protein
MTLLHAFLIGLAAGGASGLVVGWLARGYAFWS